MILKFQYIDRSETEKPASIDKARELILKHRQNANLVYIYKDGEVIWNSQLVRK